MPSNFPTSLDTNPSAATLAAGNLDTDPHSVLHANLGDQIEALEAKVGVDGSAVTTSHDYKFAQLATTYQPLDSDLTAIAALTTTAFGRALLELANAAALQTAAGTVVGTDVQAYDADLAAIAALSPSNDDIIQRKAGAWTNRTVAQYLSDLGLGSVYQPLDSDLTAIAALTTTSFGRSLLAAADASALRTLAGTVIGTDVAAQSHTQAASSITDFDEAAQDAVGGILTDTATIDFTYSDATPSITAAIVAGSVGPTQLEATAVTAAGYGSATQVGTFTVDADGRLTAAANTAIQITESQVTNLTADLAAALIFAKQQFK